MRSEDIQYTPEQLDEKKFLPVVAPEVVEREDQRLHELGIGLRHREHQPAQVHNSEHSNHLDDRFLITDRA